MSFRYHFCAAWGLFALFAPVLRAQLQCDPAAVDFGRRAQNQIFTAQVKLTNNSPGAITILSAAGDCSCTTVQIPVSELPAGESTTLTVSMESGGAEGVFQHNIRIEATGGTSVVLPVKMAVSRYVNWAIAPARLIFPPSHRGTEAAMELHVSHVDANQLGISAVETDSPYLKVTPSAAAGNTIVYEVKKLPDAPAGPIYAHIKMVTADPAAPDLDVPVFAYVESSVELLPNPIIMPTVKAGASAVTQVRIKGWDKVGAPRPELSGGEVRLLGRKDGEIILELTLTRSQPGSSTHRLRLYNGDELVIEAPVVEP